MAVNSSWNDCQSVGWLVCTISPWTLLGSSEFPVASILRCTRLFRRGRTTEERGKATRPPPFIPETPRAAPAFRASVIPRATTLLTSPSQGELHGRNPVESSTQHEPTTSLSL